MTEDRRRTTDNPGSATPSNFIRPPSSVVRRPISGRLVIATHNPGKLAEMRQLLAPFGIDAISAGEMHLKEPDETGMTFRDNARIKAQAAAKAAGLPAFADDFRARRRCARRRARHSFLRAGPDPTGIFRAPWRRSKRNYASAAQRRRIAARRISSRRSPSPGWMAAAKNTRRGSPARSFGRRAATKVLATIRCFSPDGHDRTFGEMSSEEKHGLPPRGKGLSHRAVPS